jgi:hypothetical protein
MYPGYLINNILESIRSNKEKIATAYSPHYSIFDCIISECNFDLYTSNDHSMVFFKNFEKIHNIQKNRIYKIPYSLYVANHAIKFINEGFNYNLHINSLVFCHDYDAYSIKPEEKILACQKGFRSCDMILAFNDSIKNGLRCQKDNIIDIEYAIPNNFKLENKTDRSKIGIFSYNKALSPELIHALHSTAESVSVVPENIDELNKELNEFKVVIELDPSCIINTLAAIACGAIGVINDPNNWLEKYKDIPNLYIVRSVGEIQKILSTDLVYQDQPFPSEYRNFEKFQNIINKIIYENRKKAFVL